MPDYAKLVQFVSHRVAFEYGSGVRVVGYLAATRPATGVVQLALLQNVDIQERSGGSIERRDELSLVPNTIVSVPAREQGAVTYEYDTGAKVTGELEEGAGPVRRLRHAKVLDASGRVLEEHDTLPIVAAPLASFRLAEGPRGREV